jgi:hypothetical protein
MVGITSKAWIMNISLSNTICAMSMAILEDIVERLFSLKLLRDNHKKKSLKTYNIAM